jgi:flagellar protein FlgJ
MEITGFSAHLQDYRMSTPAAGDFYNTSDFASILERAKETGTNNNNAGTIDKTDKLYQLCLELETFLVKNLLTSMRNTVQKSGLIEQGFAGKMYEDMLYDEYAKDFTKNANFGLAEQAYLQLKGRQG